MEVLAMAESRWANARRGRKLDTFKVIRLELFAVTCCDLLHLWTQLNAHRVRNWIMYDDAKIQTLARYACLVYANIKQSWMFCPILQIGAFWHIRLVVSWPRTVSHLRRLLTESRSQTSAWLVLIHVFNLIHATHNSSLISSNITYYIFYIFLAQSQTIIYFGLNLFTTEFQFRTLIVWFSNAKLIWAFALKKKTLQSGKIFHALMFIWTSRIQHNLSVWFSNTDNDR